MRQSGLTGLLRRLDTKVVVTLDTDGGDASSHAFYHYEKVQFLKITYSYI